MSSNTAPIESVPFKSRLRPLEPPISPGRIRSTTADSTHEEEKTPDNPNQYFPTAPPPSVEAHLLAGLRVKPKVHSGSIPAPWIEHYRHVAPHWSNPKRKPPREQLRQTNGFIYHPDQDVRPPNHQSHLLPLWLQETPAVLADDKQQQPLQSPIRVQPGVQAVYDPATRAHSYTTEPLQNYTGGNNALPEVKKQFPTNPWLKFYEQHAGTTTTGAFQVVVDLPQAESSTSDGHQERRGLSDQFSSSGFGRSASFGVVSRQGLSPSHDSASLFSPSQVAADNASDMLRHGSPGPDTISSTGSHQVPKSPIPAERISSDNVFMPPASQIAAPIFSEARENLERLQADIADLSDSSDASTEAFGSDLGMTRLSLSEEENSDHTTNNVREETSVGSSGSQGLRTNTGEEASSSGGSPAQKRSQLDDNDEDRARTEIGVSRKRTKLSSLRFICCFHNGPGRKCSGTDDTSSEILKQLSKQHDTHICGKCWVRKIKDRSSGLLVHPDGNEACRDHCLSPQCHRMPSSIGHRHEFDPKICKTDTSRVRPKDGEAIYRFIFRLVHPELDCPALVLTANHSLHLDAVPRQSRRKLNKEELTARANDLEVRLEAGEQQNAANATRIELLEQNLADAHLATTRAEERNAALEKQSRRIVAMLSNALRTGVFLDTLDHQSLLRRVAEDAPDALIHQSHSLLTPSVSDRSRNSSATPARVNVAGPDPFSQPPTYEGSTRAAPLRTMPREHTMDGDMSDPWANDPNMDQIWDSLVGEPGESDTTGSQPQQIDNFD